MTIKSTSPVTSTGDILFNFYRNVVIQSLFNYINPPPKGQIVYSYFINLPYHLFHCFYINLFYEKPWNTNSIVSAHPEIKWSAPDNTSSN